MGDTTTGHQYIVSGLQANIFLSSLTNTISPQRWKHMCSKSHLWTAENETWAASAAEARGVFDIKKHAIPPAGSNLNACLHTVEDGQFKFPIGYQK